MHTAVTGATQPRDAVQLALRMPPAPQDPRVHRPRDQVVIRERDPAPLADLARVHIAQRLARRRRRRQQRRDVGAEHRGEELGAACAAAVSAPAGAGAGGEEAIRSERVRGAERQGGLEDGCAGGDGEGRAVERGDGVGESAEAGGERGEDLACEVLLLLSLFVNLRLVKSVSSWMASGSGAKGLDGEQEGEGSHVYELPQLRGIIARLCFCVDRGFDGGLASAVRLAILLACGGGGGARSAAAG